MPAFLAVAMLVRSEEANALFICQVAENTFFLSFFFFFTLECHHYLNLPLNVPLNGNVTLHVKCNTQTQKNIILLMHASASESAKASGIHSFLPY